MRPIERAQDPLYDQDLQMWRDAPREPRLRHLQFLRALAEAGHLEHPPCGQPCGEYAPEEDASCA